MKAVLKYPLYRRPGATNKVEAIGYLPAGTVIDVENIIYGDAIDGINTWYKASDGFHYWEGGFDVPGKERFVFIIKKCWEFYTGKGAQIALVDSGISATHSRLPQNISHLNFVPEDSIIKYDHGNRMASLICGISNQFGIMGIAPDAKIFDYKVVDKRNSISPAILINALNALKNRSDIKIVNLSLEFNNVTQDVSINISSQEMETLSNVIDELIDEGKIVIAASGNNGYIGFPGSHKRVITVGALKNGLPVNYPEGSINMIESKPNCFIDFFEWNYCSLNDISNHTGFDSSEVTALMSALVGLVIRNNNEFNQEFILSRIKNSISNTWIYKNVEIKQLDISKFLKISL